jgi:hypothetical protein
MEIFIIVVCMVYAMGVFEERNDILNTSPKLIGWLEAGLAANGFYLVLLGLPIAFPVVSDAGQGMGTRDILYEVGIHIFQSHYAVFLPSVAGWFYPSAPAVYEWTILVLFISLVLSVIGLKMIVRRQGKKGVPMVLIGSGAFLPIGIIGILSARLMEWPSSDDNAADRKDEKSTIKGHRKGKTAADARQTTNKYGSDK